MNQSCIIIDCPEEANHHIHNPSTGEGAMICQTHVIHIEGYDPTVSNSEEE